VRYARVGRASESLTLATGLHKKLVFPSEKAA
jgi:hypothetical protein